MRTDTEVYALARNELELGFVTFWEGWESCQLCFQEKVVMDKVLLHMRYKGLITMKQ